MIRIDLHVHSSASFDCEITPAQVAERCHQLGLAPIFLTDHNTLDGALELQAAKRWRVVAGQEVITAAGEIIGLFLDRPIPAGLTPPETVARIKEAGGLVYLEHPYDTFRRHLSEESIEAISDQIDIVEVFNGRSDEKANHRAQDLCEALGAAPGAGSDAHSLGEIGSVYIEMEDFEGAADFLVKVGKGRIVIGRSKLWLMAQAKLGHKIRRQ